MTVWFFFQAEDGIRDHCVTGVQTCALPISRHPGRVHPRPRGGGRRDPAPAPGRRRARREHPLLRSEERRVGKEWTYAWSLEHIQKNIDDLSGERSLRTRVSRYMTHTKQVKV